MRCRQEVLKIVTNVYIENTTYLYNCIIIEVEFHVMTKLTPNNFIAITRSSIRLIVMKQGY